MSFEKLAENANGVPEEVSTLNEIARLQSVLQSACAPQTRSDVAAALRDQQMRLEILKEQRKKQAHRRPGL